MCSPQASMLAELYIWATEIHFLNTYDLTTFFMGGDKAPTAFEEKTGDGPLQRHVLPRGAERCGPSACCVAWHTRRDGKEGELNMGRAGHLFLKHIKLGSSEKSYILQMS